MSAATDVDRDAINELYNTVAFCKYMASSLWEPDATIDSPDLRKHLIAAKENIEAAMHIIGRKETSQ